MMSGMTTKRSTIYFASEIHRALRLKAATMDATIERQMAIWTGAVQAVQQQGEFYRRRVP